ncbi:MAG: HlyD family secretion protein [Chitinophagales bacterium]|nr:HlyD family secretion protein [Chitinophagales bacterium]
MENSPVQKRPLLRLILPLLLGSVLVFYGWRWYSHAQHFESTDNAQVETHTSPVLARIAGYLKDVTVNDYALVKSGDTLAVIDDAEQRIAVQQAEADLAAAQADLENARAALATAQADLKNAKIGVENADLNVKVVAANAEVIAVRRDKAFSDWQRDQKLLAEKAITPKQLEDSKARYDEQVKSYEAAIDQQQFAKGNVTSGQGQFSKIQTQLGQLAAQLKRAEAAVSTRRAMLDQARLRLTYTRVTAPISGRIGRKNMEPGQYIQPGQNLCTVINDNEYWIIANFKETQLEKMHEGQQVNIKLDAYPEKDVTGTIESMSEATGAKFALLPPDNASGNFIKVTQRIPVKISINNPAEIKDLLRAGLSAEVEVRVKD